MTKVKVDVDKLYAALDAKRQSRELSWRTLAKQIGVSPSTMTRLSNGHRPDADGFAAMVDWLDQPVERFIDTGQRRTDDDRGSDLMAELAPLLRSRQDLTNDDVSMLEDIIRAAYTRLRSSDHG